jgi:inosose dehydratase
MKFGYQTNTWGGVVGHPAGVTSIKDLFYLTNGSNEEALNDISEAGYQGIEIFDGNLYQYVNEKNKLKELLGKNKLDLIAVYSGANFIYDEVLEDEMWRIKEAAKLAQAFGAEHLVVGGGAIRSKGILEEDYKKLGQRLEQVVELANDYGLIANFHPHLGTIAESPEQIDKIFQHTSIKFCPDTAHLVAGGCDLLSIVNKYIERVKYIHFKDYKDGKFLPLGEGGLQLEKLANLLNEHHYDGWVTVELDYYNGHPKDGAKISKQFLKTIF